MGPQWRWSAWMRGLYTFFMHIEMEIEAIRFSWWTFSKGVTLEEKAKACRTGYCNISGNSVKKERGREGESEQEQELCIHRSASYGEVEKLPVLEA